MSGTGVEKVHSEETPTRIWVGTSGFHFDDWRGVFYPSGLPRSRWLDYYAKSFRVLELNSSYYRIPSVASVQRLAEKMPETYGIVVKANRLTTHEYKDEEASGPFRSALEPLREKWLLRGVLAQFPWSFRNTPGNFQYLAEVTGRMNDVQWFVEFRHRSWLVPEVGAFLRENAIGFVSVDEPQLREMMPPVAKFTVPTAYIRFHGRNADSWWAGGGADRYDYRYSDEELKEWVGKVARLSGQVREILIFFNNCKGGSAAINAKTMRELLKTLPRVEVQ